MGQHIATLSWESEIAANWLLLLILAIIMFQKRLHRELPVFFIYILINCASQIPSFLLLRSSYVCWWWFAWIDNAGDYIFFFAVLAEIFAVTFREYECIRRFSKTVITCSMVILLPLSACFVATYFSVRPWNANGATAEKWIMALVDCLTFIHLGLALAFLLLMKYLHPRWDSFRFGIVLGYSISTVIDLSDYVLSAGFLHDKWGYAVWITNAISGSALCFTALTWIYYALQPEAAPARVPPLQSKDLEQWDRTLSRLLGWGTTSL